MCACLVCVPGVRAWCGGSGSDMYNYNMVWRDHLVMHAYMFIMMRSLCLASDPVMC